VSELEQSGDGSGIPAADDPAASSQSASPQRLVDDETLSDVDQTAADADQTAADSDQTASDRNQDQADADQRTSNRDQAVADHENAARAAAGESDAVYESTRAERLKSTLGRTATGRARAQTATERLEHDAGREENATLRDLNATARDRAAELRDLAAARAEQTGGVPDSTMEAARDQAARVRARAAIDRARAAADRLAAAKDREQARAELRHAQLDGLTGTYGRALGTVALEHEINRARHSHEPLVLAFLDVDGLKQVNDHHGRAAGDTLLRAVVEAIGSDLRSYDPIVRVGGDEFVCALADCTLDGARLRFQSIRDRLRQTHPDASLSVGFAQRRADDTLAQLIERGGSALYAAKAVR